MSNPASGATVTRLFNPDAENHYALSEEGELELKMLFGAMAAVSQIMDTNPGQIAPEIECAHIAPLFYTFARHGERIMAELADRHPSQKSRPRSAA
ncbi:MAG: hypothetical protein E2598_06285 [Sphingobium sp.]|nr:hypothetical protein [Sphingobium sp.]